MLSADLLVGARFLNNRLTVSARSEHGDRGKMRNMNMIEPDQTPLATASFWEEATQTGGIACIEVSVASNLGAMKLSGKVDHTRGSHMDFVLVTLRMATGDRWEQQELDWGPGPQALHLVAKWYSSRPPIETLERWKGAITAQGGTIESCV